MEGFRQVQRPPDRGVRFGLALLILLIVFVGVPLALAFHTGSIAIPHNDAWSHSRIAEEYASGGGFRLVGWNRSALVGQVVVLGPLGASITAQQVFVGLLGAVGLIATYVFLRARIGAGRALLGTAVVATVPEFGLLATSYMTDVPAFAAMMVCLALADAAIRRDSLALLAGSVIVGLWGASIRDQALLAPVVVLIAALLLMERRHRGRILALFVSVVVLVAVFEWWRRGLPHGDPPVLELDPRRAAVVAIRGAFTMGLLLSPAVLLVARPFRWSTRAWMAALGTPAMALLGHWALGSEALLMPNYLAREGAYAQDYLGQRDVFGAVPWTIIEGAAVVSLGLLIGVLVEHGIRLDRTSAILGALLVVGTVGQALVGQSVFSRYLLPLVPIAALAVLVVPSPPRWVPAWTMVALLGLVSLTLTASTLAYDAARWAAADRLRIAGVPATDIDAGFEWVGYHATGPVSRGAARPAALGPFMSLFPESRQCFLVASAPVPQGRLLWTTQFTTYALMGRSTLWIHELDQCREP